MALIAVAVFVVIAGLLLTGVFAGLRAIDREAQEEITRHHMQQIIHALSIYAQKHDRLPCPAEPDRSVSPEPFGTERGSGPNGVQYGSCSGDDELIGIVPFQLLGLSERDARDGWRNFMTYRVKASLADTDPAAVPPPKVHDLCRRSTPPGHGGPASDDWVVPTASGAENKNPRKALFCCPMPDPAFDVRDREGDSLVDSGGGAPGGASYQPIHSPAPTPSIPPGAEIPDVLAVVLLSHGPNGHGAFLGDGTRLDVGDVHDFEQENADGDGIFSAIPTIEPAAGYFDDLIEWRTQTLLYSEVGGYANGCDEQAPSPSP